MKSKVRQRREAKALCPTCKSPDWDYTGRTPMLGDNGKHNFKCNSCGRGWQYGRTESIYTELA